MQVALRRLSAMQGLKGGVLGTLAPIVGAKKFAKKIPRPLITVLGAIVVRYALDPPASVAGGARGSNTGRPA